MAVFEYQALAKNGKTVKGIIDADSPVAARRKLRDQELFPTQLIETFAKGGAEAQAQEKGGSVFTRVSQRDIAMMTRQVAVLLQAGMPLVEAMSALMQQTSNSRLRKIIFDARDRVNEGVTLADALEPHKRVFSELYRNMVRAGEQSGALEQVLFRLADITERQVKLKNKVTSLLAYPILMLLVGLGVIVFLMMVIVPKITEIFAKQKQELPFVTKALIGTCNFIGDWWFVILLAIAAAFVAWRIWVSKDAGRRRWDRIKLRLPLFGPLYIKMICVRFARTLGTMLESGLVMIKALEVVKTVVQNRVIEEGMDEVKSSVRRGRDLSIPLKEMGHFPPMLIHMVELGERSGEMESMLIKVAETYEEDVELTINGLVSLLEPVIILVMGLFVGFLVMSILMPILSMGSGMR
ncbi:MAG: fimbrial assembly protein PilC [Candidatus Hydrogenedentota bacterium]